MILRISQSRMIALACACLSMYMSKEQVRLNDCEATREGLKLSEETFCIAICDVLEESGERPEVAH